MENFIVSARKYRPVTFNEVVGQKAITNTLKNAIKNNHVAQAFLFTGPRGVGKTTCARVFAKTINCQNLTPELEPCNKCDSCLSFNSSTSFNVHELDAASNNSVEDIRRLVEQVRIPPQVGQYKIYIIDEVHMLSQAAFNAFLKTLEEPPSYAKFILATTEKHKIIPTILSRCQIYDFNRITTADIALHLAYVAQQEGITAEDDALHIIARKADGALRDALSIFDQMVSFSGSNITYESAIENLNVLHTEYYFSLIDYALRGDISATLLLYDEIVAKGFEGQHFINGIAEHLRNLLVVKDPAIVKLLDVAENTKSRLVEQAHYCSLRFLIDAINIMMFVDLNYKTMNDKRLFVELHLMKLCDLSGLVASSGNAIPAPAQAPQTPKQELPKAKPVETTPTTPVSKPEPKPSIESTTSPVANVPSPQTKPMEQEIKKPSIFGLSIKAEMEDAQKQKEPEETTPQVEIIDNSPIIQIESEQLKNAVNEYAKSIENDEMAFSVALSPNRISIKSNNTVHITFTNQSIDNPDQKAKLLTFLREKFENNKISISSEVIDEQVVHKNEPLENYKKIADKNPNVDLMRSQLDLDLFNSSN